ncbi:hypothetical protein FRC07_001393, partial [Ceratobasidium sp. 392]
MACCKDNNGQSTCQCASTSSPPSPAVMRVSLPKRKADDQQLDSNRPPLWAINSSDDVNAPLPSKCDRNSGSREGVCCKELKGDDERDLIDPDIVRDV